MFSLVRFLDAALLGLLVVFGPAVAWVHVGQCEGRHSAAEPQSCCTHEPCCTHAGHDYPDQTPERDFEQESSSDGHDGRPHDHDRCSVCQSLAGPSGVTWELVIALPVDQTTEPLWVLPRVSIASAAIRIAHPRGPPAQV